MRLLDLEQGSVEWKQWRRTKRMASLAPAVLNASPYQKPRDVVSFYRDGTEQAPNAAMAHGHQYEPHARAYAAGVIGDLLTPVCAEDGEYGASLDGITDDGRTIVECKSPYIGQESPIWEAIARGSPGGYAWQIEHQLMITGAERCLYVVWTTGAALHLWIAPDEARRRGLCAAWDALWADLLAGKGAPREDDAWLAAVESYRAAKGVCEQAEAALEAARKGLIEIATCDCETGAGLRVQRVERKGNVDYAKVPALAGVDLDAYRKPASVSWRIEDVK